jgi:hypothetical protein
MKKLLLPTSVLAMLLVAVAFVSCKGGSSANPQTVAASFMDALKAKDFDGAAKFATAESKSALEMMKSALAMAESFGKKGEELDFDKDMKGKKVTYSEPKITGDNATVSLLVDGVEQMPMSLKKESGAWKVAFDKSTIMKQAASKMKDANMDLSGAADSLTKGMEKLAPAMDSLSKLMK